MKDGGFVNGLLGRPVRASVESEAAQQGYRAGALVRELGPLWLLCLAMVSAGYALGRRDC